jgi:uncharacterized damage-inducible protein DinB
MNTTLVEFFKHHLWANLRLLDLCAGLSDEYLEASVPGTYGRVRDTLIHLLASEEGYITALTGQPPEQPLRQLEGFPGFEELRRRTQQNGEALITIAGQLYPEQILQGVWRGKPYTMPAVIPLLQAINHATEHRAHIVTILSQQGITPPILDAWTYNEARNGK